MSSLYMICLDRIYGFLKEGVFKSCVPNPFSDLPTKAVNELLDLSDSRQHPPQIADVILLLTSGRLTRLDLCHFHFEDEQDTMDSAIHKTGHICLKDLASNSEGLIIHFVRNTISCNSSLEEFYSRIHSGFDIFQKCPNLQIIKIYSSIGFSTFPIDNASKDLSLVSSLKNLEVFHVPHMDTDMIRNVLEICPKLISIGENNSLDSLDEIAQRRQNNSLLNLDVDRYFRLRICDCRSETHNKRRDYISRFGGKIRSAVEFCPLVKELIIHAHQKDGYEALRFLRQLTIFRIYFGNCDGDFLPDFLALLREIGPQLEHLSVIGKQKCPRITDRFPVDVISDSCPHLQSLEILGYIFMNDSSKTSRNLALKRLTLIVEKRDFSEESILTLISNSKHLEELSVRHAESLDDNLLKQIFERNPLTELKVSYIADCKLTHEGYQMLIEKAFSIELVLIAADEKTYFYDANRLFKDANFRKSNIFYYLDILREFFKRRLNSLNKRF